MGSGYSREGHAFDNRFRERATVKVAPGEVIFPERAVLLVYASVTQMQGSTMFLNDVAELRRARETADFFEE